MEQTGQGCLRSASLYFAVRDKHGSVTEIVQQSVRLVRCSGKSVDSLEGSFQSTAEHNTCFYILSYLIISYERSTGDVVMLQKGGSESALVSSVVLRNSRSFRRNSGSDYLHCKMQKFIQNIPHLWSRYVDEISRWFLFPSLFVSSSNHFISTRT